MYKILISTENAYKDRVPHILTTGIPCETVTDILDREESYRDVVGLYRDDMMELSEQEEGTIKQWVQQLGKSLIYVLESDANLIGWLFVKNEDSNDVSKKTVYVVSNNDVNYDIWLKRQGPFWSPADFLLDDPFDMLDEDPVIDDIKEGLEEIYDNQRKLQLAVGKLTEAMQSLIRIMVTPNNG